jgi:hypothetical protein
MVLVARHYIGSLLLLLAGHDDVLHVRAQKPCVYQRNAGRYRESGCLTPGVAYCGSAGAPTNGNLLCFQPTALDDVMKQCDGHEDCVGFSYNPTARTGCLKNNYKGEWCDEPSTARPVCKAGVYDGYDKGRYQPEPAPTRKARGAFKVICACGPCSAAWGGTFAALVLGAAAVYFGGGILLNSRKTVGGSARLRSFDGIVTLLPHRVFWSSVAGMVQDG